MSTVVGIQAYPCLRMDIHGYQFIAIAIDMHEYLLIFTDIRRFQRISKDINRKPINMEDPSARPHVYTLKISIVDSATIMSSCVCACRLRILVGVHAYVRAD